MRHSLVTVIFTSFLAACAGSQIKDDDGGGGGGVLTKVGAEDPELVTMEVDASHSHLLADQQTTLLARTTISASDLATEDRPPISLAAVIDTSASMEGEAIDAARDAALELVSALEDGDRLAVIAFHSWAEVLVPSTEIDESSRAAIRDKIEAMKATGTTALGQGLGLGLNEVSKDPKIEVRRIVLLSDGVPNDATQIAALAQNAAANGAPITALGLGLEYDETLLGSVAQASGGSFHYIEETDKVAAVFHDEVLRLQRTVARNMSLALRPGPGVQITEVIGQHAAAGSDGRLHVSLGDLADGETREIVARVAVSGHAAGARVELLDAQLGFDDAVAGAGRLARNGFLSAKATADADEVSAGHNADVEAAAERAAAAAATVQAIATARSGDLAGARAILAAAEPRARKAAKRIGDDELVELADGMVRLDEALPSLVQQPAPVATQPITTDAAGANPAPAAPADAPRTVREAHGAAVEVLQGN